jgi:hypothetical protein
VTVFSTASILLRSKIEVGLPLLFSAGDSIYRGEDLRERYSEHLIMLHGTMRASVPLIKLATIKMDFGAIAPAGVPFGGAWRASDDRPRHRTAK